MTRDTAFWAIVIGLIVIPGLGFGWLRGRAIGITYRGMCADLQNAGVELSPNDLHLLFQQLTRNPRSVVDSENHPEALAIKKRRVESFIAYTKSIQRYRMVLIGLGIVALISFQYLWPNK